MDNKELNEKESLELITQMIRNTRMKLEKNVGTPFIVGGYATVIVAYTIWYFIGYTGNYKWYFLWYVVPVVAILSEVFTARKRVKMPKSYIDKILGYIWWLFGGICILLSVLTMVKPLPIYFIILLLIGMGSTITGMIIRCNAFTIGGLCGILSSFGCLWWTGNDQNLIFALAFVLMYIIPGHILNHKARKGQ